MVLCVALFLPYVVLHNNSFVSPSASAFLKCTYYSGHYTYFCDFKLSPFSTCTVSLHISGMKVTPPALAWCHCIPVINSVCWLCMSTTLCSYEIKVNNFTSSWSDGTAFCAILHRHCPNAFDYTIQVDRAKPMANLQLAFDTAQDLLGVEKLLDPEGVLSITCGLVNLTCSACAPGLPSQHVSNGYTCVYIRTCGNGQTMPMYSAFVL